MHTDTHTYRLSIYPTMYSWVFFAFWLLYCCYECVIQISPSDFAYSSFGSIPRSGIARSV